MTPQIAIVIPTYNAKNSILRLISDVFKKVKNVIVIVVDDNSPDGTAKIVKLTFSENKKVKIIIREKKSGRGSAVLRGFKEALKYENIDFFIEMDADLCHDPKYIESMIKECQHYDVVITSKYHRKSKIIGLPFHRLFISKIVNYYLRFLLQIPISDYTNGFRCYSRKAILSIIHERFHAKGFIVLSEIAYVLHREGFSFTELPFVFKSSNMNKSNFNLEEIMEGFLTSLTLRFKYQK